VLRRCRRRRGRRASPQSLLGFRVVRRHPAGGESCGFAPRRAVTARWSDSPQHGKVRPPPAIRARSSRHQAPRSACSPGEGRSAQPSPRLGMPCPPTPPSTARPASTRTPWTGGAPGIGCLRRPPIRVGDAHATGGPARVGGRAPRTSDTPPPQVGVPANPGPSSVPWNFVSPLPLPSCQPAAASRGSLLTRGTTHRGPSPPRQPWASEPCLLAQPQPALPRVGSRPLPRGKPCASRGGDRPSKACATGSPLHHLCIASANQGVPADRGVQNLVTLSRNWTGRILSTRLRVLPGDLPGRLLSPAPGNRWEVAGKEGGKEGAASCHEQPVEAPARGRR
jgi:hypothetical protein